MGQWLELRASTARGTGNLGKVWETAWETEIPHAKQHGQNKKTPQNINWKYKAKKKCFFQKDLMGLSTNYNASVYLDSYWNKDSRVVQW